MTKWGVGLAMVMLTLGPATAQCSGNPSCRDQSRYGDLQREASRLRWELHELDYSELATAEQRQAKRDELRNVCEQVAIARRTQRVGWLQLAAGLAPARAQTPEPVAVAVASAPGAPR